MTTVGALLAVAGRMDSTGVVASQQIVRMDRRRISTLQALAVDAFATGQVPFPHVGKKTAAVVAARVVGRSR
jgi:hypothetical protein